MAYSPDYRTYNPASAASHVLDEGLRAYMLRVFKTKFPEDWEKARYGEKIQFKE